MSLKFFFEGCEPPKHKNQAFPGHTDKPFHHHLNNWFETIFDGFEDFPFSIFQKDRPTSFSPKVDLRETDTSIEIVADLPGLSEKDISVTLKEDALTIKGGKKNDTEDSQGNYHHRERSGGSFERSIHLPSKVDEAHIKAKYENGVLTITLPKVEPREEEGHRIEVQGA